MIHFLAFYIPFHLSLPLQKLTGHSVRETTKFHIRSISRNKFYQRYLMISHIIQNEKCSINSYKKWFYRPNRCPESGPQHWNFTIECKIVTIHNYIEFLVYVRVIVRLRLCAYMRAAVYRCACVYVCVCVLYAWINVHVYVNMYV